MIAKKELIVKSNRIVEASYRLTLNEQRIILYSICRAREEQKGLFPDLPVTITAETFAKQFPGIDKSNVYLQLKDAMNALYARSVTIHDTDPATGLPRVKETRWLSEKAYIDGAGHVQVVFTPAVIQHITRLEAEFTSYQLEKVSKMTSASAIRIYEMLTQYRTVGTREFNLQWLRNALQIDANEYKLTGDFKKWVLDAAVKQINDHSDLKVSYTSKKTSRAITDFVFKIKDQNAPTKPKKPPVAHDQAARDALEKHGQQRIEDYQEEF
jgi:plasmid replication initiation protein